VLELFPPLLEQHLTQDGPALRTALARERLATVDRGLAAGTRERTPTVPGAEQAPERLARHWAHRVRDLRVRWADEPSPGLAVDLLAALAVTAAPRWEIDEVSDRASTLPGPPRDRALLAAWTARFRAVTSGDLDPALTVLAPVRGTVPGYEAVLRAAEGQARLAVGVLPLGTLLDPPVAEDTEEARDALAVARAAGALAAGRPGDAVALIDGVQGRCPEAAVLHGLALLLDGEPAAGVQVARAGMGRAHEAADPVMLHEHAYVAAYGLALQGRVVELHELTSAVLALGVVPQHRPQEVGSLLTFAAVAAHWQSRHDYARSVATQASARSVPRGPYPFMATDLVEALLRDGADGRDGAEALWAAARERLEAGFLPAGVALGVRAVERDPRAERAAVLVEAAAAGGAVLLRHLAAYAWALATGSAEGLAQQEVALGTVGLGQYAVRAAVAHSLRLMAEGHPQQAVAHADAAWGRAGLRGRDLCGLFRPLDRAVRVTPREREVAVLVARGWSTPEIAARMVLSVRTVESHVFSACHKVGADGREGLARVARTWLTCTPP
jgi:DNA-binding NarL/FixJ family response regulator